MEFFLRKVYPWLIEASSYSPVLPFVVGLLLFPKRKSSRFRLLFLFVVLMLMVEVAGLITVSIGTKNNLWLHHIVSPLEFSVLAAIYYSSYRKPVLKYGVLVAACAFILFSIGNAVAGDGITQFNSTARTVENALLIIIAISYFYEIANDLKVTYLDKDPIFLLSCGLLIYKAGSSMAWGMFNQALEESYDTARVCLAITFILIIIFNSSLAIVLKRAS